MTHFKKEFKTLRNAKIFARYLLIAKKGTKDVQIWESPSKPKNTFVVIWNE